MVAIVVVIVLAVSIPMALKSKKRKELEYHMYHAGSNIPDTPHTTNTPVTDDATTTPYASADPLETNTAYDSSEQSSILPAPTTF